MRFRTLGGVLVALAVIVLVSYLSNLNLGLLTERFFLTSGSSVPVYAILLVVFLLGFLPAGGVLLTQTLKRDLEIRRRRRRRREVRSLQNRLRRAVDFKADRQWGKAAAELEAYLVERPESFIALLGYGEVMRRLGRPGEALEVHRKASVLYPQSVAVLYQLADDYEALEDPDVAKQIRDRIVRDFAGQGRLVLCRRRNAAIASGDWKEASRLHDRLEALLREGGDAAALERERNVGMGLTYQRAVELLARERCAEARSILGELLEDEPRFIPATIMLGEAELLDGRADKGLEVWRDGFAATGSPVFLQRIEDHFIEREQPMQAIETLHGFIASAASDLLPRFFLGRLYYRLEMHEEALRVLNDLRERIHPSPTFHFLLARLYERRGEMAKAVRCLSSCVAEAGITTQEYVCRVCRTKYPDWMDRCESCGCWNSVEMDFEEERLSPEELGVRPGPIWVAYPEPAAAEPRSEPGEQEE